MELLTAAQMDRRITILVPDEATPRGSAGSAMPGYVELATVWARRRDLSGREVLAAAQTVPTAQCKYAVWYRADIDTRARIREGAQMYEIQHIAELGHRLGLEILATLPSPADGLEAD